jgi:hypothetical protein
MREGHSVGWATLQICRDAAEKLSAGVCRYPALLQEGAGSEMPVRHERYPAEVQDD